MGDLDVHAAITVLLAVAVVALAVTVLILTRTHHDEPEGFVSPLVDGEVTQEMPRVDVDELWVEFYDSLPRRSWLRSSP